MRQFIFALLAVLFMAASPATAQQEQPIIRIEPPVPSTTTVSQLPACNSSSNGFVYRVTDALLPALNVAVVAGGLVVVLVRCNGTFWIVGQ